MAPLLNMVFNSASLFVPARSPPDWSSSSTFQIAFLRLSIEPLRQKRQYTKACVFVPKSGAQPAAGPSDWVKRSKAYKMKSSPRSGVFLNVHEVHFSWNSQPESSPWHAAEFLPEPLWVRTHLQGQQSKQFLLTHASFFRRACSRASSASAHKKSKKPLKRLWQSDGIKAQTQIGYSQPRTCLGRWVQTAEVSWPCSGLAWQEPALIWRQTSPAFHAAQHRVLPGTGHCRAAPEGRSECIPGWATLTKCAFMGAGAGQLRSVCTHSQQMQEKSWRDSSFMAPGLQSFPPKLPVALLCSRAQQGGCVVHESTGCCSPVDSSSTGIATFLLARRDWFGTT